MIYEYADAIHFVYTDIFPANQYAVTLRRKFLIWR